MCAAHFGRLGVLLCVFGNAAANKNPVVRLADGSLVEGKIVQFGSLLNKKVIHQFLGIPFAKPPLGL